MISHLRGQYYVFTVKDNQPTLLQDIQTLDDSSFSPSGERPE